MKLIVVQLCTFCLIVAPLPIQSIGTAQAQSTAAQFGGPLLSVLKNAGQTYLNAKQQSFAALNQARIFSSLRPQTTPDKFFGCPIPQAISAFPSGACENPITSAQQAQEYSNYASLGTSFDDFYAKLSTPGNTRFPVGLQCMEEARKQVASASENRVNQLTQLQTNITKNNQLFRDQNQSLLNDVADLNSELHGSGSGSSSNTNTKTKDYSGLFSPACQETLSKTGSINDQIGKDGLLGLKNGLSKQNLEATRYNTNSASLERDLNKRIQRIKSDIRRDGIDVWSAEQGQSIGNGRLRVSGSIGQTAFGPAAAAVGDYLSSFSKRKAKITGPLTESLKGLTDSPISSLSSAQVESVLKKKYTNDCVTLNDKGVGLNMDQILASIKHNRTRGSGGNVVKNYSLALRNIMSSDLDLETKMDELRALDAQFGAGSITVDYYDPNRNLLTKTPYQMLKETASLCESKFANDVGPTITGIKKNINDLKQLDGDFINDVANAIDDQVRNCGGNSYKSSDCSSATLDPAQPAFCFSHAKTCAAQVNGCFAKVSSYVEKKTKQINQKAKVYNDRVEQFVAQQDAVLNQVRAMVQAQGQSLSSFFPGTDFQLPSDLLVEMPPLEENEFGVRLRGGGTLNFIKELPKKLDDLKDQIAKQQDKIDQAIATYIGEQEENLDKNREKWAELKKDCSGAVLAFNAAQDAAFKENSARFGEAKDKAGKFCAKYDSLRRSNPAAGCDGDFSPKELYTEALEVSSFLAPEVFDSLSSYRNFCASSQSEKEEGDDDDDTPTLISMCNQNNNQWKDVIQEVADNLEDSDLNKGGLDATDIKKIINGGNIPDGTSKDFKKLLGRAKGLGNSSEDEDEDEDEDDSSSTESKSSRLATQLKELKEKRAKAKAAKTVSDAQSRAIASTDVRNRKKGEAVKDAFTKARREFIKIDSGFRSESGAELKALLDKTNPSVADLEKLESAVLTFKKDVNDSLSAEDKTKEVEKLKGLDALVASSQTLYDTANDKVRAIVKEQDAANKKSLEDKTASELAEKEDKEDADLQAEIDAAKKIELAAKEAEEDDEDNEIGDNLCKEYKKIAAREARDICSPKERRDDDCAGRKVKEQTQKLLDEEFDSLPRVGKASNTLRSIASEAKKSKMDEKKWVDIGQVNNSQCVAQNSIGRNSGSRSFLDAFDQAALQGKEGDFLNLGK